MEAHRQQREGEIQRLQQEGAALQHAHTALEQTHEALLRECQRQVEERTTQVRNLQHHGEVLLATQNTEKQQWKTEYDAIHRTYTELQTQLGGSIQTLQEQLRVCNETVTRQTADLQARDQRLEALASTSSHNRELAALCETTRIQNEQQGREFTRLQQQLVTQTETANTLQQTLHACQNQRQACAEASHRFSTSAHVNSSAPIGPLLPATLIG